VAILPGGAAALGTTASYLVLAKAMQYSLPSFYGDAYPDQPLAPEWLQVQRQTLLNTGITNDDGSVWGATLVSGSAGTPLDVTPSLIPSVTLEPNDYTFTNQVILMQIQSLTVVSNSATEIDATNWAVVKSPTNDYVVVQAVLNYTNDWIMTNATAMAQIAGAIQWSGGDPVPGNPLQRRVTKTNSVETTVSASLGASSASLNVWVIWSTVQILTSGTNPSPLPLNRFDDGTEILGFGYYNSRDGSNSVAGKICGIATITPAGVHSIITNGWDFFQKKNTETFVDGTIYTACRFHLGRAMDQILLI